FALSLGVLAHTALAVLRFGVERLRVPLGRLGRDLVPLSVLASFSLVPVVSLPDAVRGLVYAHTSGGRFNDNGQRIFQDTDKSLAAAWMSARMEGSSPVQIHTSFRSNWSVDWALRRPT